MSLYLRLDSRSAESMNKAINGAFGEDGFNPEYLVVDGYPGYPALVRKREGKLVAVAVSLSPAPLPL